MNFLTNNACDVGKNEIFNFVLDFLNISGETLKHFYNIEKKRKKRSKI